MVDEKRQKLKDIFNAALDQKTENRQQFINEKCGGDEMMEAESQKG